MTVYCVLSVWEARLINGSITHKAIERLVSLELLQLSSKVTYGLE